MRITLTALFVSIAAFSVSDPVHADPYRYCADYGGPAGGTNCYFVSLEQCRAAISGNGGFCRENGFYDGRPVSTDVRLPRPLKRRRP